jgi:hypothetical protein
VLNVSFASYVGEVEVNINVQENEVFTSRIVSDLWRRPAANLCSAHSGHRETNSSYCRIKGPFQNIWIVLGKKCVPTGAETKTDFASEIQQQVAVLFSYGSGSVVGWSTMLQAEKQQARIPITSVVFFFFFNLRNPSCQHHGLRIYSASDRNEYQKIFLGVQVKGCQPNSHL